jgi:arginine utilization protein RocB
MIGRKTAHSRGSLGMKARVAAGMTALSYATKLKRHGEVVLAAAAGEQDVPKGTEKVREAEWRANGAVITEPSSLE